MDIKKNPCLILLLLLFCSALKPHLSLGTDNISANQSLSGDQTIVSAGEVFVLGFFKPGNSSRYYIGMWYKKVSEQTVVWVANRETPIFDRFSSVLRIYNGNLVLFNESRIPIWSTDLNLTTSNSVEAVLEDRGNLVLRYGSNSSEPPLWQSFDHQAHTWLPGAKIGYNKITNKSQLLTSWKNSEDPAPGLFSLELDPNGSKSYFILRNRTDRYWSSGPWNGHIFSDVPEMNKKYLYNFSFYDGENESYFTYSLYNPAFISRFSMNVSGQVQQQNWLGEVWNLFWSMPRTQCEVSEYCGAFGTCELQLPFCKCLPGFEVKSESDWNLTDFSGGCSRKTNLQCGNSSLANGEKDRFRPIFSMRLPENPQTVSVGSDAECESNCLNNCNCSAYAYAHDSDGCRIWIGELLDLQQLPADDTTGRILYIKLAASEFSSPSNNKGTVIGIAVGSAAGVLLLGVVVIVFLTRRRRAIGSGKTVEGSLLAFEYRDLQNATKNFSDRLGGGGFGSVFKGTLPDSTVIAVKKLDSISQGEKQFRTEVSTIGTIQHVNLVRLRGFCSDGTKKLLVYDYMPNGSIDSHLFLEKNVNVLEWKTRYQIVLGTARGLAYLHDKCRDCIIHCDIKPENILLDAEFCPKVADFGLAKLVGREFSRVLTTMRGTRGYLAPEWISGVAITAKADVYSYGMMLFEFISGRRNSEQSEDGKVNFFPASAARLICEEGEVLSLLDPRLQGNADAEELTKICRVACWCIQDEEIHRPSMGQVVQILEGISVVNVPPIPRTLQMFVDNQEQIIFFTESSSSQSSRARSNTSTASSQAKSSTSSMSNKSLREQI